MAFSKALLVIIIFGVISFSIKNFIVFPTRRHSFIFSGLVAGMSELYGRDIPRASMAQATVFG
jgi:hypothetical protein